MDWVLFVLSMAALCLGLLAYMEGVIALVRRSIWFQVGFVVGLPIALGPFIDWREFITDRLFILESSFLVLILVTRTACHHGLGEQGRMWLRRLFGAWFFFQVGGFIFAQITKGTYVSAFISAVMGLGLVLFYRQTRGVAANEDDDGRVFIFGRGAPLEMQLMYLFWVLSVLFVEYNSYLPKVVVPAIHLISVGLAMREGDFFHIRIMTANHFFLLNYKLGYLYDKQMLGADFAVLPALLAGQGFVSAVQAISVVGVVAAFGYWLARLRRPEPATVVG